MSDIAGQTAGPNGLTFFEETHGYPRGNIGLKKILYAFNLTYPAPSIICIISSLEPRNSKHF